MKNGGDLRVRRTKLCIRNAFVHLLMERPFEKLQVNDIAARAMINRSTFYLHYRDKYDLLGQLKAERLEIIDGYIASLTREEVQRGQQGEALPQFLGLLIDIRQMPELFRMISQQDGGFYAHIAQTLQERLCQLYSERLPQDAVSEEYHRVMFTAVLRCVIETWMARDFREEEQQLALLLTQELLTRQLREADR